MWSFIPKDIKNIAQGIIKDSSNVIDFFGRVERDFLGGDGVYAGDEFTPEAKAMPIPYPALLSFQNDISTYCEPFQDDEREAFAAWAQKSPLSRLFPVHSKAPTPAGDPIPDDHLPDPENPVNAYRQRLLDSSDAVLEKYVQFVKGEASSARGSHKVFPQTNNESPAAAAVVARDPDEKGGEEKEEKRARSPPRAATPSADKSSPPPRRDSASVNGLATTTSAFLDEDQFFDRYFFRLAQLRLRLLKESQREAAAPRDLAGPPEVGSPDAAALPSKAAGEVDEGEAEDSTALHYAHLVMNAANSLATNLDAIFNAPGSSEGGASRTTSELNDAPARVASLEHLVCELQEELQRERERVRELTRILESHRIEVPSFTADSRGGAGIGGPDLTPHEPAPLASAGEAEEVRSEPLSPEENTKEKLSCQSGKAEINSEVSESVWERIN